MTILTNKEIVRYLKNNIIPFNFEQLSPSSYNLRIGNIFKKYKNFVLYTDIDNEAEIIKIEDDKKYICFYPKNTFDETINEIKNKRKDMNINDIEFIETPVLGESMEYIKLPDYICADCMGRSSLARLYITSHQTGGFIDNGFEGTITFEIECSVPIVIRKNEEIAQLKFSLLNKNNSIYSYKNKLSSKYNKQKNSQEYKKEKDDVHKIVIYNNKILLDKKEINEENLIDFIMNKFEDKYEIIVVHNNVILDKLLEIILHYKLYDYRDDVKFNVLLNHLG